MGEELGTHGSCNTAGNELFLETVSEGGSKEEVPCHSLLPLWPFCGVPVGEPKQQSSMQGAEEIQSSGAEHTADKSREWV